jgi:hypothetical protein
MGVHAGSGDKARECSHSGGGPQRLRERVDVLLLDVICSGAATAAVVSAACCSARAAAPDSGALSQAAAPSQVEQVLSHLSTMT